MVCANETVVGILEVGLKGDHCLHGYLPHLLYQIADVLAFVSQVPQDRGEQLFGGLFIVLELLAGSLESI